MINSENRSQSRLQKTQIIMFVPILAIIAILVWSIQFVAGLDLKATEDGLLSTVILLVEFGLALIAIAVAVWIGLNIYNIISKNDLSKVEEKAEKVLSTVERRLGELDYNQIATEKMMLLTSLMKTHEDVMSFYFINKIFSLPDDRIDATAFSIMLYIEDSFANTITGYRTQNRDLIDTFTSIGLNYCEHLTEILDDEENEIKSIDFYRAYLSFKQAEFLFYKYIKMYNPPNISALKGEYSDKLSDAIKHYEVCYNLLKKQDDLSQKCKSYLHNSIGYSYLNKYYYLKKDSDLDKATKNCKRACYPDVHDEQFNVDASRTYAKAIYFRNYAHCFRGDSLEALKAAKTQYERSLAIDFHDAKSQINVATIALKIIVQEADLGPGRKKILSELCLPQNYSREIHEAIDHLNWAIKLDEYFFDPYFYLTQAYTLLMLTAGESDKKDEYFKRAKDNIELFKRLCPLPANHTYLFYERNLYEAHGDIANAKEINEFLRKKSEGDSAIIAALYT